MRFALARFAKIIVASSLLCAPVTAHAQDITSGLVGHWTLDETSGTSSTDSSSSGYNGTMAGGMTAAANTAAGQVNTSLNFDGIDDRIDIPAFDVNGTGLTLSGWFYLDSFTDDPRIISKSNDASSLTTHDWTLYFDEPGAGGNLTLRLKTINGTQNESTNYIPTTGQWTHVAVTYNNATAQIVYYINGVQIDTDTHNNGGAVITGTGYPVAIGNQPTGAGDRPFDGILDDVRIYERALSAADITALYAFNGSACTDPTGVRSQIIYNQDSKALQYCNGSHWVGIGKPFTLSNDLVGHWKLDETSGTTAADSSVSSNNGSMTSMSGAANTVAGINGTALSFTGGSRITAGSADTDFDNIFVGGGTISYWIYPTNWGTFGRVIDKSDSGTFPPNSGWHSQGSSGIIKFSQAFSTTAGDWETPASSVPMNTWSHITITYNSDNIANTPRIYVNASEVAVAATQTPVGTSVSDAPNPVTLGSRQGGGNPYTGYTDDVRMYGRILTNSEIGTLYNTQATCSQPATANLVGHWNLNETTGAAIADLSGNGNNGVWTDGVNNSVAEETLAGRDGTALNFDEVDNVITVPHAASLDISTGYTVSGWVYFDSTAATSPKTPSLISKNNDGGWGDGWVVGRTSGGGDIIGGKIRLAVNHNRSISGASASYSSWIYPVDTWNYVTVSWDGSAIRYYLNGALLETSPLTDPPDTSTGALHIGFGRTNWYANYFKGNIDDLRLYNRALSDTEITSLYGTIGGACTLSTCANPFGDEGAITYNTTHHVMQYCNGNQWIAMSKAGDGGGGCSSPSGSAGSLVYNSSLDTLQYCEGDEWMGIGNAVTSYSWSLLGNTLNLPNGTEKALTALDSNTVVFIDDSGNDGDLTTYSWDGTNWVQIGNTLYFAGINNMSLATLNSNTIVFSNSALSTYSWDGTDWTQIGNTLAIGFSTSIAPLSSTTIAVTTSGTDDLATYSWDGTNWTKIGSSLSLGAVNWATITALNSTTIAFSDDNDRLATYSWDGTNWTQVGNTLNLVNYRATIVALNSTTIAYSDQGTSQLRVYTWDGSDWSENTTFFPFDTTGLSRLWLAKLNSNDIAAVSIGSDSLRTLRYSKN